MITSHRPSGESHLTSPLSPPAATPPSQPSSCLSRNPSPLEASVPGPLYALIFPDALCLHAVTPTPPLVPRGSSHLTKLPQLSSGYSNSPSLPHVKSLLPRITHHAICLFPSSRPPCWVSILSPSLQRGKLKAPQDDVSGSQLESVWGWIGTWRTSHMLSPLLQITNQD